MRTVKVNNTAVVVLLFLLVVGIWYWSLSFEFNRRDALLKEARDSFDNSLPEIQRGFSGGKILEIMSLSDGQTRIVFENKEGTRRRSLWVSGAGCLKQGWGLCLAGDTVEMQYTPPESLAVDDQNCPIKYLKPNCYRK